MSTRGVDFVHKWIDENLAGFHQAAIDAALVADLAERCIAEALAQGIARTEFEDELGPIAVIIAEAIAHNPSDEVTPHRRHGIH